MTDEPELIRRLDSAIREVLLPAVVEEATRRVMDRVVADTVEIVRSAARDEGRNAARDWVSGVIGREWTVKIDAND